MLAGPCHEVGAFTNVVLIEMETDMTGKTLMLTLGLLAAVTLGCEKKEEAPSTDDMEKQVDDASHDGHDHADDAMKKVGEAAEEAGEAAKEMAEDAKEAAKDVKLPE